MRGVERATFMSRARDWPMPPAAPSTATLKPSSAEDDMHRLLTVWQAWRASPNSAEDIAAGFCSVQCYEESRGPTQSEQEGVRAGGAVEKRPLQPCHFCLLTRWRAGVVSACAGVARCMEPRCKTSLHGRRPVVAFNTRHHTNKMALLELICCVLPCC